MGQNVHPYNWSSHLKNIFMFFFLFEARCQDSTAQIKYIQPLAQLENLVFILIPISRGEFLSSQGKL